MDTNIFLSKNYISEVVEDYGEVIRQVDTIIRQTGYKSSFIAKKLGLPESTFYLKKRKKTFTFAEMKRLVELMDEDEDDGDLEDRYLMNLYKGHENEEIVHDIFNLGKQDDN
jgi:hypothetical protein